MIKSVTSGCERFGSVWIAGGLLCGLFAAGSAAGVPVPLERQLQVRSIDFDAGTVELFNFASVDIDLSGWRLCTHDFDQQRRYTAPAGFNGVTIESGTSVFIHVANDAPAGDPDRRNLSSLGGTFALPLDQDAYGMQVFFPINGSVSFANSAQIADHIQWNIDGADTGLSEERTGQAVAELLWTAAGDFIATTDSSVRIDLVDLSGDPFGGPSEYEVSEFDYSDDPIAPTTIELVPGSNVVAGDVGSSDDVGGDRDFVTFTVPEGFEVLDMPLTSLDPNNVAFIAINAGSTGFIPGFATIGDFLAGILFAAQQVDQDLLDLFSTSSITTFSLPEARLGPGAYTIVMQQTDPIVQTYSFDIVLTAIPGGCSPADVNGDGILDLFDILGFFDIYGDGDLAADINGDGMLDLFDILGFFDIYGEGC